jgi:hypothetical protein
MEDDHGVYSSNIQTGNSINIQKVFPIFRVGVPKEDISKTMEVHCR